MNILIGKDKRAKASGPGTYAVTMVLHIESKSRAAASRAAEQCIRDQCVECGNLLNADVIDVSKMT